MKKLVDQNNFDLVIGTSIRGTKWADTVEELAEKWKQANSVLVAFGAPARGLCEISRAESWNLDEKIDFLVNTIPKQGTKTVRTEEAILASLSIMNAHLGFNA